MNTVKYSCYLNLGLRQAENDFVWAPLRIHDRFTFKHQISDGTAVFTWCFNSLLRGYTTCLHLTSKAKVLITPKVCHCWERSDERLERIIWKVPYYFHIRAQMKSRQFHYCQEAHFSTIHFYSNISIYSNTSLINLRHRLHEEHTSFAYPVGNLLRSYINT